MSFPAPELQVKATGGIGELSFFVNSHFWTPIQIYYRLDGPGYSGDWTAGPLLRSPGTWNISHFEDFTRYLFTAQLVLDGQPVSGLSPVVKGRPEFLLPKYVVDLRRQDSQIYVPGRTNAFRLIVEAQPERGLPAEIFLYRRELFGAGTGVRDVFIAVCKPKDLETYPVGAPGAEPLFRLNYVDLIERADDYREETYNAIREDVEELVRALELDEIYRAGEVE